MKEATGELNMTVVTIVAIAALLAFFYLVIWPNLKVGMTLSSACNAANGTEYHTADASAGWSIDCPSTCDSCGIQTCTYTDENGNSSTRECTDNK